VIKGEKTMKFLKKIMVPLAAGLAFMAGPANAAKVTMNIGYSVNEGHPYGTFMNLFAERFETLSGGTVRVKVHCCHKMGSEQEQPKTTLGHFFQRLICLFCHI
jgi:TRAP-type C4-dicarboxylate transport system substrate-binding protein